MRKIHSLQANHLKYLMIDRFIATIFVRGLRFYQVRGNKPLLELAAKLRHWNDERINKKSATQQTAHLSLEDLSAIKQIILNSASATSLKSPEVFLDQMFFLCVGAIQTQSQTGSDQAWLLVNQSITSYVKTQQERKTYLAGFLATTLVLCLSLTLMITSPVHHRSQPVDDSPLATTEGTTDPVTMSMLLLAYTKMKSGTCQLPQAAMLPPEQRQAFLMFVNNGYIEVEHVENLRLALGYVSCLYPQELMHPVNSDGNRL